VGETLTNSIFHVKPDAGNLASFLIEEVSHLVFFGAKIQISTEESFRLLFFSLLAELPFNTSSSSSSSASLVIGWLDLDRFVACDATRFRESRIQQRDKFSGLLGELVRDLLFAADQVDQWSHVLRILLHRESLGVLPVAQ